MTGLIRKSKSVITVYKPVSHAKTRRCEDLLKIRCDDLWRTKVKYDIMTPDSPRVGKPKPLKPMKTKSSGTHIPPVYTTPGAMGGPRQVIGDRKGMLGSNGVMGTMGPGAAPMKIVKNGEVTHVFQPTVSTSGE